MTAFPQHMVLFYKGDSHLLICGMVQHLLLGPSATGYSSWSLPDSVFSLPGNHQAT
jgi:hypothetical protein